MVERCARRRRSLAAMHYLAPIYSASPPSEGPAHASEGVSSSPTLNCWVHEAIRHSYHIHVEQLHLLHLFLFFFLGEGGGEGACFVFHIPLVKMHERHNPGTVTH